MSLFRNFKPVLYKFGNEDKFALFTNLTQYVDLIDDIKSRNLFLADYTIPANERPDQVSFRLYGTTDYYWTFFLVNDHLRENGWPLTLNEVHTAAQKRYPHRLVTVKLLQPDVIDYYDENNIPIFRSKLVGTAPDQFEVGAVVEGNVSGTRGIIIKRDLSLGTFVIDTENAVVTTEIVGETISPNSNGILELARTDVQEAQTFTNPLLWSITQDDIPINGYRVEIDPFGRTVKISDIPFDPTSTYKLTYYINTKNLTDGTFTTGEELSYLNPAGTRTSMVVFGEMPQYLGTHHYEDADGNWVDIDPLTQNTSGAIEKTHLDYLTDKNEELRQIKYIKPENIKAIALEFAELMKR
jgi:hypothetical protein